MPKNCTLFSSQLCTFQALFCAGFPQLITLRQKLQANIQSISNNGSNVNINVNSDTLFFRGCNAKLGIPGFTPLAYKTWDAKHLHTIAFVLSCRNTFLNNNVNT